MAVEPPDFQKTFTAEVREHIRAPLSRAYATASEFHDEKRGGNSRTFGFGLYHYGVHEFELQAGASDGHLVILSTEPVFRFQIGEFEFACHRVGQHASDDIRNCFPSNDGAVLEMVSEQLELPGISTAEIVASSRRLVLAHLGNPKDGFGAVYACVPGRVEHGKIRGWAWTHLLWSADQKAEGAPPRTPDERAPDESVPEPTVKLRLVRPMRETEEGE